MLRNEVEAGGISNFVAQTSGVFPLSLMTAALFPAPVQVLALPSSLGQQVR